MTAPTRLPDSRTSPPGPWECSRRTWTGESLCSNPATVVLTGMCVHEHMKDQPFCADHAAKDARPGRLACNDCRKSSGDLAHFCLVSVVAEVAL